MGFNKKMTLFNKIHKSLPIYRMDVSGKSIIYTPGYQKTISRKDADTIEQAWNNEVKSPFNDDVISNIESIEIQAQQVLHKWQLYINQPFSPECLTIYLSNRCNLHCTYCYARGENNRHRALDRSFIVNEDAVHAAAVFVIQNCIRKRAPFNLVLHGGGEPTLHWKLIKWITRETKRLAKEAGVVWFGYIATNGIMTEKNASWLTHHFSRVGISCDGPPSIQNDLRPFIDGEGTSHIVECTVQALRRSGIHFDVRTTIMPSTITKQKEIVRYCIHNLGASSIRFEPAYRLHQKKLEGFTPGHVDMFIDYFIEAQKYAQSHSVSLTYSGVRIQELHGSYCDIFKNALHLTPNGEATACFFCIDSELSENIKYSIGKINQKSNQFEINHETISKFKKAIPKNIHNECNNCFLLFHCTRLCPETCIHDDEHFLKKRIGNSQTQALDFRCQLHKKLGAYQISCKAGLMKDRIVN